MLQRAKNDPSRFSVVSAPGPDAPEMPALEPEAKGTPDTSPQTRKQKIAAALKTNRKRLVVGAATAALIGLGWFGYDYLTAGRFMVSTDDAYVRADATTLAAKVPGYIAALDVDENAHVNAGDVIARIDDGDYRLAVDAARDKVATQRATVERIGRQTTAQQAMVEQAKAQLASSEAAVTRTHSDLERQQTLATKEFASRATLEQAQANYDQAVAAVSGAKASIEAASANVEVLKAQQQEASRTLDELNTALAKAERDLSFTQIRAPVAGVLGNRAVHVGDYMQVGQRFGALVPLEGVYIDANFKETQLSRVRVGQPVNVSIDAIPGHEIKGEVASLSPASGAVFSLLPPDNATGNFTKIVQRIAVRVRVPAEIAAQRQLRPGMSVVVSVNTKPTAVASEKQRSLAALSPSSDLR
ncbi:MAG: HlyD family secretion protein [Pseudolabrys sp.]|nr:HlyD family secretion protein [Pseudolabrys sp.]